MQARAGVRWFPLLPSGPNDPVLLRRQMAATGRRLRLLRAHGLINKVSKTHRYLVTEKGRRIITALFATAGSRLQ